jgi:hypothetical protein
MMAMLASGYLPIGYRLSRLGYRAVASGLSGNWIGVLGYWVIDDRAIGLFVIGRSGDRAIDDRFL